MPAAPRSARSRESKLSLVLSEFARTMATDFPIQAILDHLIERIVEMLPVTAAGVTLIAPGTLPKYIAASDASALLFEKLQTELGEGPCVLAYSTGELVEVPDLRRDPRFPIFTPRALAEGMRAVFTFPLRHDDRQLGALDLYRDSAGGLTEGELATGQTLADVAAAYLINAEARDELKDSLERSRQISLHDGLTGLANRTMMLDRLHHASQRVRHTRKVSAVIFLDLDGFKEVNDEHGHAVGDQVLLAVAQRLTHLTRPPDTVGRLHGDEFIVLCEELDRPEQATTIMDRLTKALSDPYVLPTVTINVTASAGIAYADENVHDPEQVLRDADTAMYQAKRKGPRRQTMFDPPISLSQTRPALENDLAGAIAAGQMQTLYQPIVSTPDGTVTGFEALLRWHHPVRGVVPPTTFIPLAEQSGLIDQIGRWVLEQACTDRHRWHQIRPELNLGVAVNISTRQLMTAGFATVVDTALQAEQTPPKLLTLEVTEGVFIQDSRRALLVLNDLKELGISIALDDFGTGYSSLGYLNQFAVDIIKLDQTFVARIGGDRVNDIIVSAVVRLAHELGITVIAEGIETVEQQRTASGLGCDASQGFLYARAMTTDHVEKLLRDVDGALVLVPGEPPDDLSRPTP